MSKTILVVDDNEVVLLLMKEYLEEIDMKAVLASSGEDGLRIATEDSPDAVLLDIMMPDMGGDEVASVLSQQKETRDIPVIFLTGLADSHDTSKIGPGGYRYLSKDLSPAEMQKKLKEFLS